MTPTDYKEIRRELGLSQSELAGVISTTANTVARWEGGSRKPPDIVQFVYRELRAGWRPSTFPTMRNDR